MAAFESGCIVTLHAVMGTTALSGGGVTVCGAFLLIVSETYMS